MARFQRPIRNDPGSPKPPEEQHAPAVEESHDPGTPEAEAPEPEVPESEPTPDPPDAPEAPDPLDGMDDLPEPMTDAEASVHFQQEENRADWAEYHAQRSGEQVDNEGSMTEAEEQAARERKAEREAKEAEERRERLADMQQPEPEASDPEKAWTQQRNDVVKAVGAGVPLDLAERIAAFAGDDQGRRRDLLDNAHRALGQGDSAGSLHQQLDQRLAREGRTAQQTTQGPAGGSDVTERLDRMEQLLETLPDRLIEAIRNG